MTLLGWAGVWLGLWTVLTIWAQEPDLANRFWWSAVFFSLLTLSAWMIVEGMR